jgi:hypothetical protein
VRSAAIFNVVTLIFLLLTLATIAFVGSQLLTPPPSTPVADLPTEIPPDLFPTLTPTFTHTPTYTPTFPPTFTPTYTLTATITPSLTPSNTPTITFTPSITPTPTITFTPSASPTLEPTPTATGPTATLQPSLSPFIFGAPPENITYSPNANTLGCSWQSIGGQILDLTGTEIPAGRYQVRVFGNGLDRVVLPGSNSLYGLVSGWEVQTDSIVNLNTYFVRLETINGTEISETIQVPFFSDCARNAVRVTFRQLREF